MSFYIDDAIKEMKGKTLGSVELAKDKSSITFQMTDGSTYSFGVEGDCCSHSWIEHLEKPGDVAGAVFLELKEDSMDVTDDDIENPMGKDYRAHESLMKYQSHFHTTKGVITLDYRNSSNGYYGGYLVMA